MMQNGEGKKGARYMFKKGMEVKVEGDDKHIMLRGKRLKPSLNQYLKEIKE